MSPFTPQDIKTPPTFCQYSCGQCDQPFDHPKSTDIFAAFANRPTTIASTIDEAIAQLKRSKPNHKWLSWRELTVGGQIIFCEICKAIRFCDIFVADVTTLNFNVIFKLGYAIGLGKRIILLRDTSYIRDAKAYEELGLLDTIGYSEFSNSDDIVKIILESSARSIAIPNGSMEHRSAPIYTVLPLIETEGIAKLISALNQSAFNFKAFDAKETPRLGFQDVSRHIASSVATVLPLLSEDRAGSMVHNARCAFVGGLSLARGMHVLMLQEGVEKQPIDYRDICQPYSSAKQIPPMIERLVKQVASTLSSSGPVYQAPRQKRDLEKLDFGDIAAENEDDQLSGYFVKTSQFYETLRGHARLVVGRKGTGKSAIFSQIRDNYIRRTHDYVVLDLRPEGYQLRKLVDLLEEISNASLQEQLLTALWNYIILTELSHCVLERDSSIAYRDADSLNRYRALDKCFDEHSTEEKDFSDRLFSLIKRIKDRFPWGNDNITTTNINDSIWSADIRPLTDALNEYLKPKEEIWILVDNLDKSWPARGARSPELMVLRCLLEASRKIQRNFDRNKINSKTVIFIRNDVFELLVSETPDRGKESYVSLDQTDPEVLKEILRMRAVASLGSPMQFDEFALRFFDLHVGGEDAFRFLFRHTFGRARDVIKLIKRCIETSINRGHAKVTEDDMISSINMHSEDILRELKYEIRDTMGEYSETVEEFVESPHFMAMEDVIGRIIRVAGDEGKARKFLDSLLWYSFLGVQLVEGHEAFAFEDQYNIERLLRRASVGRDPVFVVHPAYRTALHIAD